MNEKKERLKHNLKIELELQRIWVWFCDNNLWTFYIYCADYRVYQCVSTVEGVIRQKKVPLYSASLKQRSLVLREVVSILFIAEKSNKYKIK
jgi:hypothetical protein